MTNNKIDRRISYKIVLENENCKIDKSVKEVNENNMWSYD